MLIVGKKLIFDMKESTLNKIKKYYNEHLFFENYRGWVIRIHSCEAKYLGTLTHYTCDVNVSVNDNTLFKDYVDSDKYCRRVGDDYAWLISNVAGEKNMILKTEKDGKSFLLK